MKALCLGGGPSGLYFSILMKKAFPQSDITVLERNKPDDTFGWGVVFSRETLGNLETADSESYARIAAEFAYWDDIEAYFRNRCVVSTGHGFCGLSRRELLLILQARAKELGVKLEFQREFKSINDFDRRQWDLILASDGVHSLVREEWKEHFKPRVDWRKAKFCWLGTNLPLRAFTFIFKETPHGLFQVHAYPFDAKTSTFIVECREDVWRKAGLDTASEADTVAFCEKLFAEELKGHRLLTNKSIWRTFPTISNAHWHHENVCLIGDAAHTAHFSIGSGTKLAMEDAIALVDAFREHGSKYVGRALDAYETARRGEVAKLQRAAQTSLEWFENSARYLDQEPIQFTFNLMTRSKRITYDNLAQRDPKLVRDVAQWFARKNGAPENAPPIFTPFTLRKLTLDNRIVVSPMCQYSATDGVPNDWHLVHLGSRAIGGAGLVFTEMTDVSPEGRITYGCAGLWNDAQEQAWARIVQFVHAASKSKVGIQLAHAGRKASCAKPWEGDGPLKPGAGAWQTLGPSAIPFNDGWHTPREMDATDMARVRQQFADATRRALRAGFDIIELHAAHGYLLSSFLSPLSNRRSDEYGGSLENRLRFPLEVLGAVRAAWPNDKPISVRISASDWLGGEGLTPDDAVTIARSLHAHGADLIDVSSAGNVPQSRPEYGRMYQVPFADQIRHEAKVPVMAVGGIQGWDHANTVVAAGRADLCAIARAHLADPYLTLHAASAYDYEAQWWPNQYLLGKPRPKR